MHGILSHTFLFLTQQPCDTALFVTLLLFSYNFKVRKSTFKNWFLVFKKSLFSTYIECSHALVSWMMMMGVIKSKNETDPCTELWIRSLPWGEEEQTCYRLPIINEIYRKNVQLKIGLNSIQIYFFKCKNLIDKTFLFLENLDFVTPFPHSWWPSHSHGGFKLSLKE